MSLTDSERLNILDKLQNAAAGFELPDVPIPDAPIPEDALSVVGKLVDLFTTD